MMTTAVSINIKLPSADISFVKELASRMGWSVSDVTPADNLFDPESGQYLNDETMQAIRDVEAGKVTRCKDMSELLALI
ncbi:MAG: hypothetical protein IJ928_08060 [Prevotella sp.]|nr:hypothetical protein [Prevotella sp.]